MDGDQGPGPVQRFSGEIVTGDEITASTVTMTVDATSVDTGIEQRDADLRSARFFDTDVHPAGASDPRGCGPRATVMPSTAT